MTHRLLRAKFFLSSTAKRRAHRNYRFKKARKTLEKQGFHDKNLTFDSKTVGSETKKKIVILGRCPKSHKYWYPFRKWFWFDKGQFHPEKQIDQWISHRPAKSRSRLPKHPPLKQRLICIKMKTDMSARNESTKSTCRKKRWSFFNLFWTCAVRL